MSIKLSSASCHVTEINRRLKPLEVGTKRNFRREVLWIRQDARLGAFAHT